MFWRKNTIADNDKANRQITLAYFDQKSTVDYIGAVQGIPVCFDAKECATKTFALANIHDNQVQFMKEFENQGGIAFFLLYFSGMDVFYYLRYRDLSVFWERMINGGRKSFKYEELDPEYVIPKGQGIMIPYLELLNKDLESREEEQE